MTDYARMNELYSEAFGDHRPARSAIGVAELPIGALVRGGGVGPLRGRTDAVLGAVLMVLILLVILPVGMIIGGGVIAAIMGQALSSARSATSRAASSSRLNK